MNTLSQNKCLNYNYGALSKFFHWTIAILVILMLLCSYFIGNIPDKILRGAVFNGHKLIGLTILTLVILRLIWKTITNQPPSLNARAWERWIEKTVHWLLYLAFLMMPIAGWVGSVAGGKPPRWGKLSFNLPISKSDWLSDWAFSIHNSLAIIIISLVSLHILAALYHYFIKKDGVLQRMWP